MDSLNIENTSPTFRADYRRNAYIQPKQMKDPEDNSGKLMLTLVAIGSCALATAAIAASGKNEKSREFLEKTKNGITNTVGGVRKKGGEVINGARERISNRMQEAAQRRAEAAEVIIEEGIAKTKGGKLYTGLMEVTDEVTGVVTKNIYKKGKLTEVQVGNEVVQKIIYAKKGTGRVVQDYSSGALKKVQYFDGSDKIKSQIEYDADNFLVEIFDRDGNTARTVTRYQTPFMSAPAADKIVITDYLSDGTSVITTGKIQLGKDETFKTLNPSQFAIEPGVTKVIDYRDASGSAIKSFTIKPEDGKSTYVIHDAISHQDVSIIVEGKKITFEQKKVGSDIISYTYDAKNKNPHELEMFMDDKSDKFNDLLGALLEKLDENGLGATTKTVRKVLQKIGLQS